MPGPISRVRLQNLKRGVRLPITLVVLLISSHVGALAQPPDLMVRASFAGKQAVSSQQRIALILNRSLQPGEGRLVVFIGLTDMTALFTSAPRSLTYAPTTVPLPAGETFVTIHLVSPVDSWKELARFTLSVAGIPTAAVTTQPEPSALSSPADAAAQTVAAQNADVAVGRFGFDKFAFEPSLAVGVIAQPGETHFPAANRPERSTYADLMLQGSLRTDMARGLFNAQTQFDLVGTSFQGQALRFDQLGRRAPQIDLSSYLMQFQVSKVKVALGQVSFGANRFLLDGFSSRGVIVAVPVNQQLDVSLAALNGTSIVGWSNFTGLDTRQHQHLSGTIGYEFLPERRGGLRFEATVLHGSLLPISNFNQGSITDAEQSKGFGLRFKGSNESQRLRVDAGFARSRFTNPEDPTLTQGLTIAPALTLTRNAHYVEAGYDVLREHVLAGDRKANLTVTVRHERIAPLYRSVAALAEANKYQNQFEVSGNFGELAVALSDLRFNDNLDNLPSIMKAYTRRQGAVVGASLASLSRDATRPWWWLPTVGYSFDRTHQFANSLPSNAEFSLPQLPNQISINHSFSSEWQRENLRFGYSFNHSLQNNRAEREGIPVRAALGGIVHGFRFSVNPVTRLDLNFELNHETLQSNDSNANTGKERNDRTLRYGIGVTWRMSRSSGLVVSLSDTLGRSRGDFLPMSNQRTSGFEAQWSHAFAWEKGYLRKVKAQFYLRYANQYARSLDFLVGINTLTRSQMVNTGLTFTFF